MNAAETILAAIDKLEEWSWEIDAPPVVRWLDQEHIPGWDGFIVIGDSAEEGDDDCNPVARVYTEELADMLVGLHRTIDAQLAVLRAGRSATTMRFNTDLPGWAAEAKALALPLAHAILGDDS